MINRNNSLTRLKRLRRLILSILNDLYLFPQSERLIKSTVQEQFSNTTTKEIRDCFTYFSKRNYIDITGSNDDLLTAKITAKGVDIAQGSIIGKAILTSHLASSRLKLKKAIRSKILEYCSWYPESFNSDDEIHSELQDQNGSRISLESVRMDIWYLSEKCYTEMRTQPIFGDFIYLARITAKGINLVEQAISDPGVSQDE
ncbi:MAG: hypothetical protein ACN4E2_02440 [Nitrospinota bacterium]